MELFARHSELECVQLYCRTETSPVFAEATAFGLSRLRCLNVLTVHVRSRIKLIYPALFTLLDLRELDVCLRNLPDPTSALRALLSCNPGNDRSFCRPSRGVYTWCCRFSVPPGNQSHAMPACRYRAEYPPFIGQPHCY